jgi:uncharacterized protein
MTNELLVRELYRLVGIGDFNSAMALMSNDIIVIQADSLPFGGIWRGKEGFAEMAGRIIAAWPGFK